MFWQITGKFRGKRWRDKFCECCGSLMGEYEYEKDYQLDSIVEAAYPDLAIDKAKLEAGIDEIDPYGEWVQPAKASPLPTDQVMLRIGAPALFEF